MSTVQGKYLKDESGNTISPITSVETIFKDNTTLLDLFYPVGSYYETSNTTFDPNVTWGGTWLQDSSGYVTVAKDTSTEFGTVGNTGGNKTVNLQHTHDYGTYHAAARIFATSGNLYIDYQNVNNTYKRTTRSWAEGVGGGTALNETNSANSIRVLGTSGSSLSTTQNILQPYKVVLRWHRTA